MNGHRGNGPLCQPYLQTKREQAFIDCCCGLRLQCLDCYIVVLSNFVTWEFFCESIALEPLGSGEGAVLRKAPARKKVFFEKKKMVVLLLLLEIGITDKLNVWVDLKYPGRNSGGWESAHSCGFCAIKWQILLRCNVYDSVMSLLRNARLLHIIEFYRNTIDTADKTTFS